MSGEEIRILTQEAVDAASRHCYCPTCSRGGCPVRDKVQRTPRELGGLDECRRFGGGYQQMEDNFSRLQVLNRYREGYFTEKGGDRECLKRQLRALSPDC